MRVRITVGTVTLAVEGIDYTRAQVKALLGHVAGVALAVAGDDDDKDPNPIGFTAIVERAEEPMADTVDGDDE